VKGIVSLVVLACLVVGCAFAAGYVVHALWLVFLLGWDAMA
jgi:hypothetical protein